MRFVGSVVREVVDPFKVCCQHAVEEATGKWSLLLIGAWPVSDSWRGALPCDLSQHAF